MDFVRLCFHWILWILLFFNFGFSTASLRSQPLSAENNTDPEFYWDTPHIFLAHLPDDISLQARKKTGERAATFNDTLLISGLIDSDGDSINHIIFQNGEALVQGVTFPTTGRHTLLLHLEHKSISYSVRIIPGVFSIIPPLVAILIALLFQEVMIALLCGIGIGCFFLYDYQLWTSLLRLFDTSLVHALADPDHATIILFTLTIGGLIGILTQSGSITGIVERLSAFTDSIRNCQLIAWLMGLFIFIDDYANTLVVGHTMRPFTDSLRISREKLAFIVDSTAAPVCTIALISSWIGYELGLLQDSFESIGMHQSVYFTFLQAIPYSFYSLFSILFVFFLILFQRDYGAMYTAETRSATTGKVLRDGATPLSDTSQKISIPDTPRRWYNAVLPILSVIIITVLGLYYSGHEALGHQAAHLPLRTVIAASNSLQVLLWASVGGVLVAGLLVGTQRILPLRRILDSWINGTRSMVIGCIILVLAWALGAICHDIHTAPYIVLLTKNILRPEWIPALTFLIAGLISFSTGTSWGTMAILIPLIIPLTYESAILPDAPNADTIMLAAIGSILSGATFGDHCSPISDTTIMSSVASACDHIDHVKTQLPYSLSIAGIALLTGYIPAGFGFSPLLSFCIGIILLIVLIRILGKHHSPPHSP